MLGGGSVGHVVADALRDRGEEVVIVDCNEDRAEVLREQGFDVIIGDITEKEVLLKAGIERAVMVYVLTPDDDANAEAIRLIREINEDTYVIARVTDEERVEEFKELGADEVLSPNQLLVEKLLHNIDNVRNRRKVHELLTKLEDVETLAIIPHNNPDPDSIASAVALQEIASIVDVQSDVVYGGEIGHQENKALVNLLDIEMKRISRVDLDEYDAIAVVDTPVLPRELAEYDGIEDRILVAVDHHDSSDGMMDMNGTSKSALELADFVDHRPEVGAASTILTQYLKILDRNVDRRIATALLYGIRTDTLNFTRNVSPEDLKAAAYLYPRADHEALAKIESPDISPETLDVLGEAIRNRTVIRSYLFSNVGFVKNEDALPQAADYLLNLEGVHTVIVFGVVNGKVKISARTDDIRLNIGEIMKEAFGDVGSAGGHSKAAAAEIPLGIFQDVESDMVLDLVEQAVRKRIFKVIGIEEEED
ncbi:DHH family phosphoesterase [Methanopyrus kandleri]|uniref:DHH family phosphoesterase n=1 Tax=Methanopyrus kandleri TaxID=2320 RepID=UPI001D04078D|nr:DHH family phosphoesterase [Methanopyrus kandleri]